MKKIIMLILCGLITVAFGQSTVDMDDFVSGNLSEKMEIMLNLTNVTTWSGASCSPPGPDTPVGPSPRWLLPLAVSAVLSVLIIVALYLLGKFFNDPKVNAMVSKEIYQIVANIILIFFILFLLVFINGQIAKAIQVVHGLDDPVTLQQAACYYTLSVRDAIALDISVATFTMGVMNSAASVHLPFVPMTLKAFDLSLEFFYGTLASMLDMLLKTYSLAYGEWVVKAPFIQFFSTTLIEVILPIGLIMRNFSGLRRAGGAIVAMSLALYFIYPAMLYLNSLMISEWYNVSFENIVRYGRSPETRYGIFQIFPYYFGIGFATFESALREFFNLNVLSPFASMSILKLSTAYVKAILGLMTLSIGTVMLKTTKFYMLGVILFPILTASLTISTFYMIFKILLIRIVSMMLIVSIILPLINISVTLTAAKDISRFLGSEISFASLVSLI